jgi:hypothetical protein
MIYGMKTVVLRSMFLVLAFWLLVPICAGAHDNHGHGEKDQAEDRVRFVFPNAMQERYPKGRYSP